MTTSIQHTLQFLIRPLTARNSISLKSRIMARGPVSVSSRDVQDALAPRSRPSVPPSGSEQRGTWGRCVGCRAQPSFRLRARQKKQRIHGTDLTSRQKKENVRKSKKKKRFIYNVRLLGDKYQMYFVGRGRHDGPEDFANRFSAKLL